jgi:hypothetical protein
VRARFRTVLKPGLGIFKGQEALTAKKLGVSCNSQHMQCATQLTRPESSPKPTVGLGISMTQAEPTPNIVVALLHPSARTFGQPARFTGRKERGTRIRMTWTANYLHNSK